MSRRVLTTYLAAVAMAIGTAPLAEAQSSGARPNPSGGSSGSAVSRPSGGGGSSSGGGAGSSSSAGSSSAPSSPSAGRPSGGSDAGYRPARPERRVEGRAVPRSGTERGGSTSRVAPGGGSSASAPDSTDGRRRAVPAYSRPRDGRPTTGSAVGRTTPPPRDGDFYYYDPFYRYNFYFRNYPYGYYYPGYGFGLGYFYDPWLWGYSYGGYDPYYYGGGAGHYRDQYRDAGHIRLKVKPNHGQVFVDGYYAGEVDSFDGVFQKLTLDAGAHRIEIRAEGFEPVQFDVMVVPGETITYKGELNRMQ